jgi:protease-4
MRNPLLALALLALLAPFTALSQTGTLADTGPARSANLPPTGVALADTAYAAAINPAGLVHLGGAELNYVIESSGLRDQLAQALHLAGSAGGLGGGLSVDWIRGTPDSRKVTWSLALGGEDFSVGLGYHWLGSRGNPELEGLSSVDLGILTRPFRFLSIGAVARNLDQPSQGATTLRRQYAAGIGLRPLGDRYTLGVDYLFDDLIFPGRLQYTAQAEISRGVRVGAGFSHHLAGGNELLFQLALTVDTANAGLTYALGGSGALSSHLGVVRLSTRRYPDFTTSGRAVALIDLDDLLAGSNGSPLALLGLGRAEDPYLRLARLLEHAERDEDLHGVILKIDGIPDAGMAKVEELRQSVLRLRKAGKKVIAVVLKAEDPHYLVASAADHIYAVSESILTLDGLRARAMFVGGTMEKLDVSWDVARVGAYKNAPDIVTRTEMAPEQREALDAFLESSFQYLRAAIEPRAPSGKLEQVLDEALIPAERARALGLVDEVLVPEDLNKRVQEQIPGARFEGRYSPAAMRDEAWGNRRRIAIVPVIGSISGGKSRRDPLGDGMIAGAETVVRALGQAAADPSVAAIVVRVDSGGGEGLASSLMYQAVLEAKKKKPVVASMGDYAASGGYYASMGADEIFASPATLTGSIGVFLIKPVLGGLLNTLGASQQTLTRGKYADQDTEWRAWTPEERQIHQKWVDAFYDAFITEAARSRKMKKEDLDRIARGRIWSGADARARGLVDRMGGLHDAIASARARAGIPEGEEVELTVLGEPQGVLSALGGEEGVLARLAGSLLPEAAAVPPLLAELGLSLGMPPSVLLSGQVLAVAPFRVDVR